ncbi:MAG: protein-glutamate O-methyltransferase CheR [Bacteriovorax sp.]|nr:protein-glutamate O-methyltransferase CheR [Bacteriovorax sp.]
MDNQNSDFEIELGLLLEAIYLKYKYDFRDYSRASLKRRMSLALRELNCATLSALQDKILHDPIIFSELLQYLTIPVTEMFRDPSYFRAIREKVIPVLKTYPSLKIWVAGCSTGEEAYSYAILLKEEGLLDRTIIYATDINAKSLQKAQAGVFGLDDIQKFTKNYQRSGGKATFSDYYTANFDAAIFHKSLKSNITFTDHSLSTDSVFSETQFISCRNVLIYFDRKLQDRALGLFYESLGRKGFLGLGPKETIEFSKYAKAFDTIIEKERIYQKNENDPLQEKKL